MVFRVLCMCVLLSPSGDCFWFPFPSSPCSVNWLSAGKL